jgi:hypothetical protein
MSWSEWLSHCTLSPRLQSGTLCRAGVQFLEVCGIGLYICPCRAMLDLLGNLLSTIVQKCFFDWGKGRIQSMTLELCFESPWVGFPFVLTCSCVAAERLCFIQCGLMDTEVTKGVRVHRNTSTYILNPGLFFSDVQIRDTSEIHKMLIVFYFQNWECSLSIMWRSPEVVLLNGKE